MPLKNTQIQAIQKEFMVLYISMHIVHGEKCKCEKSLKINYFKNIVQSCTIFCECMAPE